MCRALVAANIPWNAVHNQVFRDFLQKYTKQNIPSASTLKKNYLDICYDEVILPIREDIGDSCIWLCVDETTDPMGRYIANLIVGKLDPNQASTPHLLCCKQLEKVNSQSIAYFINKGLQLLYPGGVDDSKVLLLISDAASYMIASAPLLTTFYPSLIHVTCMAHALHRLAETIRAEFPAVNNLISAMKKVFCKAPSRIAIFREKLPSIPLPPQPIITLWGSWLEAALYYAEHLEEIMTVIDYVPLMDNSACVSSVKELLKDYSSVQRDIAYIQANFSFLPVSITKMEEKGNSLKQQFSVIEEAENNIQSARGKVGDKIRGKWASVLKKNPGYSVLKRLHHVMNGDKLDLPSEIELKNACTFSYAPITSVCVERSFSAFKMILTDKRHCLTVENLEKIIVMYCKANYE